MIKKSFLLSMLVASIVCSGFGMQQAEYQFSDTGEVPALRELLDCDDVVGVVISFLPNRDFLNIRLSCSGLRYIADKRTELRRFDIKFQEDKVNEQVEFIEGRKHRFFIVGVPSSFCARFNDLGNVFGFGPVPLKGEFFNSVDIEIFIGLPHLEWIEELHGCISLMKFKIYLPKTFFPSLKRMVLRDSSNMCEYRDVSEDPFDKQIALELDRLEVIGGAVLIEFGMVLSRTYRLIKVKHFVLSLGDSDENLREEVLLRGCWNIFSKLIGLETLCCDLCNVPVDMILKVLERYNSQTLRFISMPRSSLDNWRHLVPFENLEEVEVGLLFCPVFYFHERDLPQSLRRCVLVYESNGICANLIKKCEKLMPSIEWSVNGRTKDDLLASEFESCEFCNMFEESEEFEGEHEALADESEDSVVVHE